LKISLLWRISLLGLIPFILLLIASGLLVIEPLTTWYLINPLLLTLVGFLVFFLAALIVSSRYIQLIQRMASTIDNPYDFKLDNKPPKGIPTEINRPFIIINQKIASLLHINAELVNDKILFDSTLRNMNDGIFIVDENENVTLINPSACRMFGIERQKAINHTLAEALRNHRINDLYQASCRSGQQEVMSFELAPNRTFIHCIATPLDPDIPGNILFLLQDLTRTRQLEIVRRDFVSNVSHELRTPLASLKLISETLQENALDDPPAARKFLDRMEAEIDNLIQLVAELLELSRIESGRVPLEKEWSKPSLLINRVRDRMALQAERAGIIIKTDVSDDLPAIFFDLHRLEQVLVNLVHNSIKFTNPGGSITLKAEQKQDEIIFHVCDSGIGIPSKDLERIFERFYKIDRSRTERGTGLGLSISRHLVEAHNGKIWAASEPGVGSTFSFSIPIR
jgi:two-component system phosphate regulon sensor histidine kinase PhoR